MKGPLKVKKVKMVDLVELDSKRGYLKEGIVSIYMVE